MKTSEKTAAFKLIQNAIDEKNIDLEKALEKSAERFFASDDDAYADVEEILRAMNEKYKKAMEE